MADTAYVAFLRGINVGGHTIKMDDLKKKFESFGFKNVKTLLASGNVIFETSEKDVTALKKKIEEKLKAVYGYDIETMLRSENQISELIHSDPFQKIPVTKMTRLYITFLAEKPNSTLQIPYISPQKDFTILKVTDDVIVSHLELIARGTIDAMNIVEKEYGKKVTTRNWNTVLRIGKVLGDPSR